MKCKNCGESHEPPEEPEWIELLCWGVVLAMVMTAIRLIIGVLLEYWRES